MRAYKVEDNRVIEIEDNIAFEDFYFIDKKKALKWAIKECKSKERSTQGEIDKLAERRKILVDEVGQMMIDIFRLQDELEELG